MSTTNLGLDTIETTDSIQNAFLTKMNSNMQKLDDAYGSLKAKLIDVTGESNFNDAIDSFNAMAQQVANLKSIGDATASDIFYGKTALVKGNVITGSLKKPEIKTVTVGSGATTVSFTFSFNPQHFYCWVIPIGISCYYTNYYLISFDGDSNTGEVIYSTGRSYYSYAQTGGTKTVTANDDGTYTVTITYNGSYQSIMEGTWRAVAF